MAVANIGPIEQYFSNAGAVLNGGKVYTYAGGTTTPLATYTSSTGGTANANPVVLDSSGRTEIWVTKGLAYKFVLKDSDDVTLETVDNFKIDDTEALLDAALASAAYDLWVFFASGPPLTEELLFQGRFPRAVTFPANWTGSYGRVNTNATAEFVITVKKNGSTVGTITIATNGTFTFATSAGAAVSFATGDYITCHAQVATDATLADIAFTLAGEMA